MIDHIANRGKILESLRQELVGPTLDGVELDCSVSPIVIENPKEAYGPFKEKKTGEEIISQDTPTKRYGIGVLYPAGVIETADEAQVEKGDPVPESVLDPAETTIKLSGIEEVQSSISSIRQDDNPSDFDISLANAYRQSSIGISFLAEINPGSKLELSFEAGRYYRLPVVIKGREMSWWRRETINFGSSASYDELTRKTKTIVKLENLNSKSMENLKIEAAVYSRQYGESKYLRLFTVSVVNRTDDSELVNDEKCVFQSGFKVKILNLTNEWNILPYPGRGIENGEVDEEEQSLNLLYRLKPTFCTGHGCSGDWINNNRSDRAHEVIAQPFPTFQVPSISSEITDEKNKVISIPIAPLAGLVPGDNGYQSVVRVIQAYENWIERKTVEVDEMPNHLKGIARKHLENCLECARRMRAGLEFISKDEMAASAFQLANRAVLMQQSRPKEKRRVIYDKALGRIKFLDSNEIQQKDGGEWRAFQIAFLLMAVESTASGVSPERDLVELIWFPTGGGKTEAYLGLAAFSLFLRRLKGQDDFGVNVLMRYTLRLLTSQQFLRASRLILAMESIRQEKVTILGQQQFSIGMWVGGENTPNRRASAIKILRDLSSGNGSTENKFVLDRCPWCGAEMGPIKYKGRADKFAPKVLGYQQIEKTVAFLCPDRDCIFSKGLPIYVIDEDIFLNRPSLVIGTVDKFATLAWNPKARAIFGLGEKGDRISSPPALIIQDELHLISGPLGSMVGLYETVIENLCTDTRDGLTIKPKIVASTATIRRYQEQVLGLYGREKVMLFPPPGLDAGDSFFAKFAVDQDGLTRPGRLFVGVHAPGLGSLQTAQVRTFSSLLQAPMQIVDKKGRDPWWTLLVFFNSLRELGTTLSLLQADIPDYTKVIWNRLTKPDKRWRWDVKELTGRAKSEDIPKAISELEREYPNDELRPIDVCLASSILEVGVDIDRLSLMVVVGQPKTTSQYIQVTGRVGRSWWERPGLVVTIYSSSKPRDRSHFEKFRTYHERLYEQVEPSSVTPFSPPALDRALHAVLVAYVRQHDDQTIADSPYPYPEKLINEIKEILIPRIRKIDPLELPNFERVFNKLSSEWKSWQMVKWEATWQDEDPPLLRRAGSYVPPELKFTSWETPNSMRNVDAECIAEIANPPFVTDLENAE